MLIHFLTAVSLQSCFKILWMAIRSSRDFSIPDAMGHFLSFQVGSQSSGQNIPCSYGIEGSSSCLLDCSQQVEHTPLLHTTFLFLRPISIMPAFQLSESKIVPALI
jgi:hypothetical protein